MRVDSERASLCACAVPGDCPDDSTPGCKLAEGKRSSSLIPDAPEPQAGSGAPCNICGVNWPFHADACAYAHTARENQRLKDGIHAAVSLTYIDGERARLQARVALKEAAGWPLTDGESKRLAELRDE